MRCPDGDGDVVGRTTEGDANGAGDADEEGGPAIIERCARGTSAGDKRSDGCRRTEDVGAWRERGVRPQEGGRLGKRNVPMPILGNAK